MRYLIAIAALAAAGAPCLARAEAMPKWEIACERPIKDKFGEKTRQYCSLLVFNQKASGSPFVMDDGTTFVMNSRTVLEIDARGIHPKRPPAGRYCPSSILRIAVDGKRIDALPALQQIQAMVKGQTLVWEEQADWPTCQNKAPHGTTLEGFQEALKDLDRQFQAIR